MSHVKLFRHIRGVDFRQFIVISAIVESALKHKIMGTIAGDDTLLLLLREQADVESIMYILESALPGIKERRI